MKYDNYRDMIEYNICILCTYYDTVVGAEYYHITLCSSKPEIALTLGVRRLMATG